MMKDVSPLVPNKPVELEFDILPVSMVIKAGHRIRLLINFADESNTQARSCTKSKQYTQFKIQLSYLTLPVVEVRSDQA
jgi:predicted acyl esterase